MTKNYFEQTMARRVAFFSGSYSADFYVGAESATTPSFSSTLYLLSGSSGSDSLNYRLMSSCVRAGPVQTITAPSTTHIVQHNMSVRSIFTKFALTSCGYWNVSSSKGRLCGFIIAVETLLKMRAPNPNPPMIIPEVRPGYLGNQSHAWWTGAIYTRPWLIEKASAMNA